MLKVKCRTGRVGLAGCPIQRPGTPCRWRFCWGDQYYPRTGTLTDCPFLCTPHPHALLAGENGPTRPCCNALLPREASAPRSLQGKRPPTPRPPSTCVYVGDCLPFSVLLDWNSAAVLTPRRPSSPGVMGGLGLGRAWMTLAEPWGHLPMPLPTLLDAAVMVVNKEARPSPWGLQG